MKTRLLTDEASQAIRNQAAESSAILLQQGWIGSGDTYAVEFYPGDVQRLEMRLSGGQRRRSGRPWRSGSAHFWTPATGTPRDPDPR